MATELLPESLWEEVRPLLPPKPPPSPKGGRPPVDDRAALAGILYVDRYGVPWQALPAGLFGASGSSCWRKFRDWTRAGVWPGLHERPLNRLGKAGGVDLGRASADSQSVRAKKGGPHAGPNPTDRGKDGCKRHVLTDAADVPLVVRTTPANVNDEAVLPALLDALPAVQGPRGRPRRKPGLLFGDRAYGTAALVALVVSPGIGCFLAPRNRRAHGSGLGAFRHVVERSLANLSQFRRIAMCHERTPEHRQAMNEIAACCLVATRLKKYEI